MITTMSAQDFNRDPAFAKRSTADGGVVFITERGKPAYVLLSHAAYSKLTLTNKNIFDVLYIPEAEDIDFELPVRT